MNHLTLTLLILLMVTIISPSMADEQYVVTFTGMDDGSIKVMYKDAGASGASVVTLPTDNPYNQMIRSYLEKFKLFK